MLKAPPTEIIYATGLADAWGQLVQLCLKKGMEIGTQYENTSIDMCCMTEILQPYLEPMLHPQFPTKEMHLNEYKKQWDRNYDWIKQGFEYNYMDRLINYPIVDKECNSLKFKDKNYYGYADQGNYFIDQISRVKDMLTKGVSRRIQALTWIPNRDLFVKEDQPCYDIETEVLTKTGWKLFKNISYEDEIITLKDGKFIEFQHPTKLISYNYNGNMILFEGHNLNFKVTPNHNMYVKSKTIPFGMKRADDLYYINFFKNDGIWNGIEQEYFILEKRNKLKHDHENVFDRKIPMDNWLKFLAIYLSDGDTFIDNSTHRVRITNGYNKDKYREILNSLHESFNVLENQDAHSNMCTNFIINNKELAEYTKQFGKAHHKFIPEFVKSLSSRQIRVFLNAYKLGDCHNNGNTIRYTTVSKKLADDLQELIFKSGTSSNIWSRKDVEYYEVKEKQYSQGMVLLKKDIIEVPYNDMVYCIEVPNHIIYVRRHGKSMWCGNCLQRLWFRPLGNGNAEMHCMWRSRDLFTAWNSNMVGLLMMVKKEILEPNNLKLIKVVDFCNSLHIYRTDIEEATKVKRIAINPQLIGRI